MECTFCPLGFKAADGRFESVGLLGAARAAIRWVEVHYHRLAKQPLVARQLNSLPGLQGSKRSFEDELQ